MAMVGHFRGGPFYLDTGRRARAAAPEQVEAYADVYGTPSTCVCNDVIAQRRVNGGACRFGEFWSSSTRPGTYLEAV